ncbi:S-adenosylmethionine sensor upstream of mTORC1 [Venturia canescens]|uniref:S-adenosylmethionine sensor upstream of mTORC1 n=1 Tax=Venturia canescens TaxID=32260 RepID=UPI001C9D6243|nr:S-adenosylmethionine sensor upstream of mTORC1 [Venturia canescens]
MASDDHKKLANFIKSTHNQLRKESRLYGPMEAWERHLARTEVLKNYATSMRELATNHWEQNEQIMGKQEGAAIHCRNQWIRSRCYDYFFKGGKAKFDQKETNIRSKMNGVGLSVNNEFLDTECIENESSMVSGTKIGLLDVGSCYNPLGMEEMFCVTPIDIAPSTANVIQCDFLNIELAPATILSSNQQSIEKLGEKSFDAVVFSLLLEYFPCPKQRFECCKKAYNLLKERGILIIVTPDSNHIGANARIIKSWRLVLSRMGFMRIVYEKLRHLHCLVFRKCVDRDVAARWFELQNIHEDDKFLSYDDKIYIPQDFSKVVDEPAKIMGDNVVYDRKELVEFFEEMPGSCDVFE